MTTITACSRMMPRPKCQQEAYMAYAGLKVALVKERLTLYRTRLHSMYLQYMKHLGKRQ